MSRLGLLGRVFLSLSLVAFAAASALAQDPSHTTQDSAPQAPAHASADLVKPGPEQAFLAKRAGEYTRTIKFVGQPDANAFSGTSKISVALGGRFIIEENNDAAFGRPVSGMRIYGYNNVTKQYEAAWMYTMSTAIISLTGTSSDGGKTIDLAGTTVDLQGKTIPLHAIMKQTDDDEFVVTLMTAGADGKESPFQETMYKRKK
jgi:hypothetical protein